MRLPKTRKAGGNLGSPNCKTRKEGARDMFEVRSHKLFHNRLLIQTTLKTQLDPTTNCPKTLLKLLLASSHLSFLKLLGAPISSQ